jgi:hypothetical protein
MPIFINTTAAGANVNIFGIEFSDDERLRIYPQRNYSSDADYIETQAKLQDVGSWYHIVVGMDTTKELNRDRFKVYINGTRITDFHQYPETTQNTANISTTSHLLSLGQRFAGTKTLHAVVGDLKYIDGRQVRADEFGELKYGVWVPKAFNKATGDSLVTSNLTANYDFTNGSMADLSGNNNTATNRGSIPYKEYNYGVMAPSGSTSQSINIPNIVNVYSTTVNIWANMNGTDEPIFTFFKQAYAFIWQPSDGYLQVYWGGIGYITDDVIKISNKWNMITLTAHWSGSIGTVKVYVNGKFVAQGTTSTQWSNSYNYYENSIAYSHHTSTPKAGEGFIGEFQVYSSPLTEAQIFQNYSATKHKYGYGLAGAWLPLNNTSTGSIDSGSNLKLHLDASNTNSYPGTGTSWLDLSGNSATATLNGVNFLSSTNGGVFDFDGSNDDATIDDTKINYSNFSLEFWMNPDANLTSSNTIFARYSTTASQNTWHIRGNDTNNGIEFIRYPSGVSGVTFKDSTSVPANKWTHVTITHDETTNKLKFYKNGALDATHSFSGSLLTNTTLDLVIGRLQQYQFRYDGQLAQVRFYNDILTAQEVITNYRATQGNYEQLSTVDISGNANNFSENILNLDYTNHSADTPTENYARLDTNYNSSPYKSGVTISNGSLTHSYTGGGTITVYDLTVSTLSMANNSSDGYYWEVTDVFSSTYASSFGITQEDVTWQYDTSANYVQPRNSVIIYQGYNDPANTYRILETPTTGTSYADLQVGGWSSTRTSGQIWMFAFKNGSLYIGKNGSWLESCDPVNQTNAFKTGLTGGWRPSSAVMYGNVTKTFNFGAKGFAYTPPTGYKALATHNLPNAQFDPRDSKQNKDYFKAISYVGNGNEQKIVTGFRPDLVWIKTRNSTPNNYLQDSVRGTDKLLISNSSLNELTNTNIIQSFDLNGFTVGSDAGANFNGNSIVAWCWKAAGYANTFNVLENGSTTSSATAGGAGITAGSITTGWSVSANRDAGFSIVKYSGNTGADQTVGHGLSSSIQ